MESIKVLGGGGVEDLHTRVLRREGGRVTITFVVVVITILIATITLLMSILLHLDTAFLLIVGDTHVLDQMQLYFVVKIALKS